MGYGASPVDDEGCELLPRDFFALRMSPRPVDHPGHKEGGGQYFPFLRLALSFPSNYFRLVGKQLRRPSDAGGIEKVFGLSLKA